METVTTKPERLSTTLTGISGEYFVAAELSRRGMIAAITLRNSRGIDILVSRPGGKKPATIQVKTNQDGSAEWLLSKSDEDRKGENHYYVFVALNGPSGTPNYHVAEGDYVADSCAKNHREWLKGKKKNGGERKDSSMRVFRPGLEYKDAWKRICLD